MKLNGNGWFLILILYPLSSFPLSLSYIYLLDSFLAIPLSSLSTYNNQEHQLSHLLHLQHTSNSYLKVAALVKQNIMTLVAVLTRYKHLWAKPNTHQSKQYQAGFYTTERLATGWTTGRSSRSPAEAKGFFLQPLCPDRSGAHPASCTMGTGSPFAGGKERPGRDANHSPPSSAEVENE
jgi:hypothetical protein